MNTDELRPLHTNVLFRPDSAKIIISGDADLTELSFAIETVLSNFIGRGIAAFEFNRSVLENKSCVINAKSLVGSQLMVMSKVGNIGYAVQNGVYPSDLSVDFLATQLKRPQRPDRTASEGQNRLTKYFPSFASMKGKNYTESVVVSHDFDPQLPLSHITYGLSDMFTGLFAMGVNYLKWQGSMKESQLYIQHTFSEKELQDYLLDAKDYDLRRKVATL